MTNRGVGRKMSMKDHDYYRSEKEAKYPGPGRSLFGESAPPDQPAGMAEVRKKKGLINEDSVPSRSVHCLILSSFEKKIDVPSAPSPAACRQDSSFRQLHENRKLCCNSPFAETVETETP